jgi:hypothetical protein
MALDWNAQMDRTYTERLILCGLNINPTLNQPLGQEMVNHPAVTIKENYLASVRKSQQDYFEKRNAQLRHEHIIRPQVPFII